MAIEKMKFLSMTGKEENLDFIIANDLLGAGFQPENALKVLEQGWKLTYFSYDSTIKEYLKKAETLLTELNITYKEKNTQLTQSFEDIKKFIDDYELKISTIHKDIENKQKEIEELSNSITPITHLQNFPIELEKIYNLKYMNFRFGFLTTEYYEQLSTDIDDIDAIVMEIEKTDKGVWIIYFTPDALSEEVDSYFKVMKFKRVWLPEDFKGKPSDVISEVKKYIQESLTYVENQKNKLEQLKGTSGIDIINAFLQLKVLEKINRVKKYMAHDDKGSFYIVGWIPNQNLKSLLSKLKEHNVAYTIKSHDEVASTPPTKLKNNKLIKPFESIVKMYGTPNYTEMDPTWFVAITAFLMFGFMFGDVGQGLVIAIIGLILMKKKSSLGPVLTAGGISAIIFGFIYGSIFGKEGIIKGIVPSPMENIQNMLIFGIASGAVLIIIAMIFNIKNGLKNKDLARALFDKNGLAGLIFYSIILISIVGLLLNGQMILGLTLSLILIILPLICILFKDNLEKIITKQKSTEKASIVEKIFELIEMLLSMASNTISFVRLAAFAINHVGLCMAVYILSTMVGGAGSLIVAIIGNIIVIVLEGLIVAIQVLRLEYYELFSRFYAGDGKEYIPIESQNN
ncbi:MAG: V-type ATP synthase subunit I [Clostridia bacterium]